MDIFHFRKLIILIYLSCVVFNAGASSIAGRETLIGVCGHDFVMLGADTFMGSSICLTSRNIDKLRVLISPFPFTNINKKCNKLNLEQQQTILVSSSGESGDCDQLIGMITSHSSLREFEAGIGCDVNTVYNGLLEEYPISQVSTFCPGLDAESVAFIARAHISSSLRSSRQLNVCLLIAGFVRSLNLNNINQILVGEETSDLRIFPGIKTCLVPKLFWIDEYGSLQSIKYGVHGYGSNFALSILDESYHPSITESEAKKLIRKVFQQLRTRYVMNSPKHPNIKCINKNGYRILH